MSIESSDNIGSWKDRKELIKKQKLEHAQAVRELRQGFEHKKKELKAKQNAIWNENHAKVATDYIESTTTLPPISDLLEPTPAQAAAAAAQDKNTGSNRKRKFDDPEKLIALANNLPVIVTPETETALIGWFRDACPLHSVQALPDKNRQANLAEVFHCLTPTRRTAILRRVCFCKGLPLPLDTPADAMTDDASQLVERKVRIRPIIQKFIRLKDKSLVSFNMSVIQKLEIVKLTPPDAARPIHSHVLKLLKEIHPDVLPDSQEGVGSLPLNKLGNLLRRRLLYELFSVLVRADIIKKELLDTTTTPASLRKKKGGVRTAGGRGGARGGRGGRGGRRVIVRRGGRGRGR